MKHKRCSGVLLHPTSLPGKYGIGTLGREAYKFVDFLVEAGQKIWQILPLGYTGYGNSPYQCYSSIAGNPLLIDLEDLVVQRLLESKDLKINKNIKFSKESVNFEAVETFKIQILRNSFHYFSQNEQTSIKKEFSGFCNIHQHWLDDFALFMSLKKTFNQHSWHQWSDDLKLRKPKTLKLYVDKLSDEINFQKYLQFLFFRQWTTLREYANFNNIKIMGDIPLYVSFDSVDAWVHSKNFQFDEKLNPVSVAGVPPDYFSETGQLWGNPLYNWEVLQKHKFKWWIDRMKANLKLYDLIRIDHFRGLSAYWAIPATDTTAVNGKWVTAPGKELFTTLLKELGDLPIIAEDLGVMTPEVENLRDSFLFPGMKILQFAFGSKEENDFLPHAHTKNFVVYTGTHDNDTTRGWWENISEEHKQHVKDYLNISGKDICWDLIRTAWASSAVYAIVPLQDILGLSSEARMNFPGTMGNNWQWRFQENSITEKHIEKLKKITLLFWR